MYVCKFKSTVCTTAEDDAPRILKCYCLELCSLIHFAKGNLTHDSLYEFAPRCFKRLMLSPLVIRLTAACCVTRAIARLCSACYPNEWLEWVKLPAKIKKNTNIKENRDI